ncbi:MAG: T9SS type A sorting domain-containing protein [Ignavibacteriae bacterium]|nr:T9SS type A sorting domain-containing protein [Ignavibacteriota bacterium]
MAKVLSLAILMVILTSAANLFADNTYYSINNNNPSIYTSWNSRTNGTGSNPSTFNNNTDLFIIQAGHTMTIASGSNWSISAQLQLNTGANLMINGRTLTINGTLTNNSGSITGSTSSNLIIGGSGANISIPGMTLNNFTINRSNGVTLTGDVTVSNTLTLTNGVLNTSTSSVIFTSSANNPTESNTKRIDGTAVMQSRSIPTSFTFLGAYFGAGSDNLGTVSMTRTTGAAGVITNGSNNSIACNWDITAQNQPVNGKSMTYNWFSTWDYGNTFNQFNNGQVYYSTDNGASWATIGNAGNASTGTTTRAMTISTTHYSKWVVASTNSPLPVSLSSFTSSVKNNSVTLNWSTISEINNKGFEIERTEAGINDYAKVGFVDGKGTTNQVSNYSFSDSKLNSGKYSYRIKQVDFNGNFEYFSLNSGIEIGAPKKFTLSQNYPNPFNPSTKIDYEIPADSKVNIVIYDISGKEVQQIVNEYHKAGYYTAQFNASQLSSGTYFYKLSVNNTTGTEVLTKKMTLIK